MFDCVVAFVALGNTDNHLRNHGLLAEDCGLTSDQAWARMRTILEAFATWKERARSAGIREREIAMMADSIDTRLAAVTATASKA